MPFLMQIAPQDRLRTYQRAAHVLRHRIEHNNFRTASDRLDAYILMRKYERKIEVLLDAFSGHE